MFGPVLTFAVSAALFLFLVLRPQGRPALASCLIVAFFLVVFWLALYLDLPGFRESDDTTAQVKAFFVLLGLSLAWFMASTLQVLRRRFPADWPAWSWPAVALVTLAVIGLGVYRMLVL